MAADSSVDDALIDYYRFSLHHSGFSQITDHSTNPKTGSTDTASRSAASSSIRPYRRPAAGQFSLLCAYIYISNKCVIFVYRDLNLAIYVRTMYSWPFGATSVRRTAPSDRPDLHGTPSPGSGSAWPVRPERSERCRRRATVPR